MKKSFKIVLVKGLVGCHGSEPVRYLRAELSLSSQFAGAQLLTAVVVVELSVALHLLCLLSIPCHVLRALDNLVDKGFYHVLISVHDIVFCLGIAVTLYFVFYYT